MAVLAAIGEPERKPEVAKEEECDGRDHLWSRRLGVGARGGTGCARIERRARPRLRPRARRFPPTGRRAADRLAHLCGGDGRAEWVVAVGHPADQLVAAATKTEATLIVVGSHGPRSSSLGSISAEVSRRAPCPVVVVPPGSDHGFRSAVGIGRANGDA
jgi:hypothetical protein